MLWSLSVIFQALESGMPFFQRIFKTNKKKKQTSDLVIFKAHAVVGKFIWLSAQ